MTTLLVMAKEPVPGRVKTRLCPPCSPEQAALLATAALVDTFEAVGAAGADRVVVALDGAPGEWLPTGVEVVPQVDGPFGARLDAAWQEVEGPTLQLGMDTPQVSAAQLSDALERTVAAGSSGAVLGPAADGGWWALGTFGPRRSMFDGVTMSTERTGREQRAQLGEVLGLGVVELETMVDVDDVTSARAVAVVAPMSHFARALGALSLPATAGVDG